MQSEAFVLDRRRALQAPIEYSSRLRLLLLSIDVSVLVVALLLMLHFDGDARRATATTIAAFACSCGAALLFGTYARSYSTERRDLLYAVAASAAAACAIYFVITLVPRAFFDRWSGLAVIVGIAIVGGFVRAYVPYDADRRDRAAWSVSERGLLAKRCMDVALSLLSLPILLAVGAIVAIVIFFDDGAPIFFVQQRVGAHGRVFRMFKFRTMKKNSGGAWVVRDDDRITRSGRFLRRTSVDELPQILNVLRGEMSLVGPRPEMTAYAADFSRKLPRYADRHRLPPGITGWAQVTMPRNLSTNDAADVLAHDLYYVDHWTLGFDSLIIAKTAAEVLFHRAV